MSILFEKIEKQEESISIVGLGYVGICLATAFSKMVKVIGFDINNNKIEVYKSGVDLTKEVGDEVVKNCTVHFTSDSSELKKAKFHIVAVPTPVNTDKTPDLSFVTAASSILAKNLSKGSVVVYESTVYPGVTENICIPVLEKESGLKCGIDFKVGYSPERINPGDKVHRLSSIVKIVSGMDEEALDTIARVYELIVEDGVYRAPCIKVAEAAKITENCQRDINIAFMNELSMIFNRIGIDTKSVIEAAETKWNFVKFHPGLVGGHCIGVDPYYLTYLAEQTGYHSQVIIAGRRINDCMGKYVAENIVKKLIAADRSVKNARVAILGFTFKENCPDTRNTRVIDIVNELGSYGISSVITDPVANKDEVVREYSIEMVDADRIKNMDAVILAVSHDEFIYMPFEKIASMFAPDNIKILIDLKGIYDGKIPDNEKYIYWSL